jgi:acetyl-CoA synthetase
VFGKTAYDTSDEASRDEGGYSLFVRRSDDVIKTPCYRVGAFEVESVLMERPLVVECAITGVPDEIRGAVVFGRI